VFDRDTQRPRPAGYGDIGVLAMTTTSLPLLFEHFDQDSVPYAACGGRLFLGDPLHRTFLLGLCALADRDDGVATAALLRPPFFAVDLGDLARSRVGDPMDRAEQARAIVRELRRRRFERGLGATARALLEDTGFGRVIAIGPNAAQRLDGVRELCCQIEARGLAAQLDFDATMEQVRGWVDRPLALDRTMPVTGDAVRVLTVHQAKGLEFPIVALWDARATWREQARQEAWTVERHGRGWAMSLDSLRWEEPAGLDIAKHEQRLREAERKRLVYVAATRARDVVVIPEAGRGDPQRILATLLGPTTAAAVLEREIHTPQRHAAWFDAAAPASTALPSEHTSRDAELAEAWSTRAASSARRQLAPVSFARATDPRLRWGQPDRFGAVFGDTVHDAIGLVLAAGITPNGAVQRAAGGRGLRGHRREATEDVVRALRALEALGLTGDPARVRLEYPIASISASGDLVAGYIDLVGALGDGLVVLDFKTDRPPTDDQLPSPYVLQVRGYARALTQALQPTSCRAGLLFTADGGVRWLAPEEP
jgi:ATP-dependent helicase/nuclease subunit A